MSYTIDGYQIDACLTISSSVDSDVVGDVLESGARYTDHVQALPRTLQLDGVVSDHPIGALVAVREAERAGGDQLSYRPSLFARTRLSALVGTGPIDIVTPDRTYSRYALKTVEFDEHPHALRFSVSFVEVITVSLERQLVAVAVPTATGKKNLGLDPIAAVRSLVRGVATDLADLAGNPVQIYDEDGRMAAWRNSRTGEWIDSKGRVVDPFDPAQQARLKRPHGLGYDHATGQLLTPEGLALSRTSAARPRSPFIDASAAPAPFSGTRAIVPSWDKPFGTVR